MSVAEECCPPTAIGRQVQRVIGILVADVAGVLLVEAAGVRHVM